VRLTLEVFLLDQYKHGGMAMNETKTVSITRKRLLQKGYLDAEHPLGISGFHIEEQASDNERIRKLLATASKKGNAGGKPEFIITRENCMDTVIVVECKANINKHESANRDKYADYAVDGVLHYASFLCREFNVIAVAVSGDKESLCKTDVFKILKGSMKSGVEAQHIGDEILCWEDFQQLIDNDPETTRKKLHQIMEYSQNLHDFMRDEAELTEQEKPLLVSAILIGLSNKTFAKSYGTIAEAEGAHSLSQELVGAVKRVLSSSNIPKDKMDNMFQPYGFIPVHQQLNEGDLLLTIIKGIDENLRPFMTGHREMDLVGQFYGEFLRYTGGDKKFGIVLTPRHVTELFSEIADVQVDSTVLDICMGTGGFLISSMVKMMGKAGGNSDKIQRIKQSGFVGIEQRSQMYALAAANMILRDDGKSNLILDSCFNDGLTEKIKSKHPTIGMINPPYGKKNDKYSELHFVSRMLSLLENNGMGIAVVPMSCAVSYSPMKEEILKHHALLAVMSMPNQLFDPAGTVTCIMVFRAHNPHNPAVATWFGYWKDDGFEIVRNQGRVDAKHLWKGIRDVWIDDYRNRREVAGRSVLKSVSAHDEWCAEAYMETDYSTLSRKDFEREVKKYAVFKVIHEADTVQGETDE